MLMCVPPSIPPNKCSRSVMPRWSKKQSLWELGHVIVDVECTSARCHLHVCLVQCGIIIIVLFCPFCSHSTLWDGIRRHRVLFAKRWALTRLSKLGALSVRVAEWTGSSMVASDRGTKLEILVRCDDVLLRNFCGRSPRVGEWRIFCIMCVD